MKYWVYILYCPSHKRTYVGQTQNLEKRIRRHNDRQVNSTRRYGYWVLIYKEGFQTRVEAIKKEKFFKSGAGRELIKNLTLKVNASA